MPPNLETGGDPDPFVYSPKWILLRKKDVWMEKRKAGGSNDMTSRQSQSERENASSQTITEVKHRQLTFQFVRTQQST